MDLLKGGGDGEEEKGGAGGGSERAERGPSETTETKDMLDALLLAPRADEDATSNCRRVSNSQLFRTSDADHAAGRRRSSAGSDAAGFEALQKFDLLPGRMSSADGLGARRSVEPDADVFDERHDQALVKGTQGEGAAGLVGEAQADAGKLGRVGGLSVRHSVEHGQDGDGVRDVLDARSPSSGRKDGEVGLSDEPAEHEVFRRGTELEEWDEEDEEGDGGCENGGFGVPLPPVMPLVRKMSRSLVDQQEDPLLMAQFPGSFTPSASPSVSSSAPPATTTATTNSTTPTASNTFSSSSSSTASTPTSTSTTLPPSSPSTLSSSSETMAGSSSSSSSTSSSLIASSTSPSLRLAPESAMASGPSLTLTSTSSNSEFDTSIAVGHPHLPDGLTAPTPVPTPVKSRTEANGQKPSSTPPLTPSSSPPHDSMLAKINRSSSDDGLRRPRLLHVPVPLEPGRRLGVGVHLVEHCVQVHALHNDAGQPGLAEQAGICIDDVILGVNFKPPGDDVLRTAAMVKEASGRGLTLQVFREDRGAVPDSASVEFPEAAELVAQVLALGRAGVLASHEKRSVLARILRYLERSLTVRRSRTRKVQGRRKGERRRAGGGTNEDPGAEQEEGTQALATAGTQERQTDHGAEEAAMESAGPDAVQRGARSVEEGGPALLAPPPQCLDCPWSLLDLVLFGKSLRGALCVRCLHTRQALETMKYILRVEDVASGQSWLVEKRYRDFYDLRARVGVVWPPLADITFPPKLILQGSQPQVIEERVVGLEFFLRESLAHLTALLVVAPQAGEALALLQAFLGVKESFRPPEKEPSSRGGGEEERHELRASCARLEKEDGENGERRKQRNGREKAVDDGPDLTDRRSDAVGDAMRLASPSSSSSSSSSPSSSSTSSSSSAPSARHGKRRARPVSTTFLSSSSDNVDPPTPPPLTSSSSSIATASTISTAANTALPHDSAERRPWISRWTSDSSLRGGSAAMRRPGPAGAAGAPQDGWDAVDAWKMRRRSSGDSGVPPAPPTPPPPPPTTKEVDAVETAEAAARKSGRAAQCAVFRLLSEPGSASGEFRDELIASFRAEATQLVQQGHEAVLCAVAQRVQSLKEHILAEHRAALVRAVDRRGGVEGLLRAWAAHAAAGRRAGPGQSSEELPATGEVEVEDPGLPNTAHCDAERGSGHRGNSSLDGLEEASEGGADGDDAQGKEEAMEELERVLGRAVQRQCEATVFLPLRRFIFWVMRPFKRRSQALQQKLELLRPVAERSLRLHLPASVSGPTASFADEVKRLGPWRRVQTALSAVSMRHLPCDQVDSLCSAASAVADLYGALQTLEPSTESSASTCSALSPTSKVNVTATATPSVPSSPSPSSAPSTAAALPHADSAAGSALGEEHAPRTAPPGAMSADEFLPMLTFCVIHATPSHLLRTSELLRCLIDPSEAIGERGYHTTSFQGAVEHIIDLINELEAPSASAQNAIRSLEGGNDDDDDTEAF